MEKKRTLHAETAYAIGLPCIALGAAIMERADLGMSMVVAPAYVVYRKLSMTLPFFTFGMAEYLLQAILLVAMCILLRRFRLSDLFSFVTALIYGLLLDGCMLLTAPLAGGSFPARITLYVSGMIVCAVGIALMFHTYIAPEVYELFTKEVSLRSGIELHRFKTMYDCVSCLAAILLSFSCFGFGTFVGVKIGTIFCALINGTLIGICSKLLEKHFRFADALPFRTFFTGEERTPVCISHKE